MRNDPQTLVSTEWLQEHLKSPEIRILDASWYMPADNRDTKAEYERQHIPGARFFDIDEISDKQSDLPHMVPSVDKFTSHMRSMGIGDEHKVVVYDSTGIFSAARVWWMFRHFGKPNVAVLDGGLKKWLVEGKSISDNPPTPRERQFTAQKDMSLVRDVTQVASTTKLKDAQIIDARTPDRFAGKVPEPREGLRSGHIPGSVNVFFKDVLNDDGTMKDTDQLRTIFEEAGVDINQPTITSCGSGVTAAVLSLALARLEHQQNAVYDGSWSEWGMYPDLKVELG